MKIQESLGYILNTSARFMKRSLDIQLKAYDITSSQWAVLSILSVDDNLSQAEIASRIHSDRTTCGTIIDKLAAKKLVSKIRSQNDRRSYKVRILPKAMNIMHEVSSKASDVNALAVKGLSESDIKTLIKCLNTITRNLNGRFEDENHNVDHVYCRNN